jgi:hypothetical protein
VEGQMMKDLFTSIRVTRDVLMMSTSDLGLRSGRTMMATVGKRKKRTRRRITSTQIWTNIKWGLKTLELTEIIPKNS